MLITQIHKQNCLNRLRIEKGLERVSHASKDSHAPHVQNSSGDYSYETALSMLEVHLQQLSNIKSEEEKIHLKKQFVPQYLPYLHAYVDSGVRYANNVLVRLVIWLIDIGDIENALKFGEYAIEQQQVSPPNFNRTLPEVVAEMITEWAERQFKNNASAHPYLDRVVEMLEKKQWNCGNVIIPTKAYKQMALYAENDNDFRTAVHYFEKCVEVNPEKHGVKTKLEVAKKKLDQL